jgi:hypothetical protein
MLSVLFLGQHKVGNNSLSAMMLHVYVMGLWPIQLLEYLSSLTRMEELSKPHFLLFNYL